MSARARVRLTLEFDLPGGGWGDEVSVGQVFHQAQATARECVMKGFSLDGISIRDALAPKIPVRIIGDTLIEAVIVDGKF